MAYLTRSQRYTYAKIRRKALQRAFDIAKDICDEIEWSPTTPRDTGALSFSYTAHLQGDEVVITSGQRYWRFVEYGTSRNEAQPHIAPAVEIVRRRYQQ